MKTLTKTALSLAASANLEAAAKHALAHSPTSSVQSLLSDVYLRLKPEPLLF